MPHYIFPSEFIFWSKNALHEKHKDALLPKIYANLEATKDKQKGIWLSEVNTEYFDRDTPIQKYMDLITDAIYPALDAMFKEIPNIRHPATSKVHNIWYNQYEPTGNSGQEVHTHPESDYSGVYFLELVEKNTTMFYSHLASVGKTTNSLKETDFIEEGDILIFPSALMHYVLPPKKQRVTVAFNITCAF